MQVGLHNFSGPLLCGTAAVKVADHQSGAPATQRYLEHESEILSVLRHPNIVNKLGAIYCPEDSTVLHGMVLELCHGTLADIFTEGVRAPNKLVHTVARGLFNAVAYASGLYVVHNDIKLENVLIKWGANGEMDCRLADWGLATGVGTLSHCRLGPAAYSAPEVARVFQPVPATHRSDVWMIGIVLMELLSGMRVDEAIDDIRDVQRKGLFFQEWRLAMHRCGIRAAPEWMALCRWCLQEDLTLRPTAQQVVELLEACTATRGHGEVEWCPHPAAIHSASVRCPSQALTVQALHMVPTRWARLDSLIAL